jgi:hypothetical protein
MAQPGTARALSKMQGSSFPQGYPGSNPGAGVIKRIFRYKKFRKGFLNIPVHAQKCMAFLARQKSEAFLSESRRRRFFPNVFK